MIAKHRILRDLFRHYLELETLFKSTGQHTFEWQSREHPEPVAVSFLDLQGALRGLSPRKKEAVFFNVVLDWKQKDVAEQMGITTVSVGQYVEQAMIQVAKLYWPEEVADVSEVPVSP